MKKALLSILFLGIVGFISYSMYIDYKTNNEWLFKFTESNDKNKFAECKVYSHWINGVVYDTTMIVGYFILEDRNGSYEQMDSLPSIDISHIDIIKSKTVRIFINDSASQDATVDYHHNNQRMQINTDILNKSLYEGKKVTLKMMRTNGEDFIVSFQGNEQFATQVDKCRKTIASKLEEYKNLEIISYD